MVGIEVSFRTTFVRVEGALRPGRRKRLRVTSDHPLTRQDLAEIQAWYAGPLGIDNGLVRDRFDYVMADDRLGLEIDALDVPSDKNEPPTPVEAALIEAGWVESI